LPDVFRKYGRREEHSFSMVKLVTFLTKRADNIVQMAAGATAKGPGSTSEGPVSIIDHEPLRSEHRCLDMDAQRNAVLNYLDGGNWKLIAEFAEVESGKRNNRQELNKAIALCRKEGATLVIAKLDRLARNAAFLLNLRDGGVDFIAVDMPHADKFTVGILALVAEKERDLISQRTRDGLAAARRRGIKLGNPHPAKALKAAQAINLARADAYAQTLAPVIQEIRAAHVTTLKGVAQCLNARGFKTPNGKSFQAQSVKNVVERTAGPMAPPEPVTVKRDKRKSPGKVANPKRPKPALASVDLVPAKKKARRTAG
jgi:DNA invertase Pin-like site-specific DNA recombinase